MGYGVTPPREDGKLKVRTLSHPLLSLGGSWSGALSQAGSGDPISVSLG